MSKYLILLISGLGFLGALALSLDQFRTGVACPTIIIPVCYLITAVFGSIFIAGFFDKQRWSNFVLFGALTIGLLISTLATVSNFFEVAQCPLTNAGIPMCYLAWGSFLSLLLLSCCINAQKLKHLKNKLLILISILIIIIGLGLLFSPLPGAFIVLILGFALLITASNVAALCIKFLRSKFKWVNKVVNIIEAKAPKKAKDILDKTKPEPLKKNETHKEFIKRHSD